MIKRIFRKLACNSFMWALAVCFLARPSLIIAAPISFENLDYYNSENEYGQILSRIPAPKRKLAGLYYEKDKAGNYVFLSLEPKLQSRLQKVAQSTPASHVAVVVMDASSGKIRAIAEKSPTLKHPAFHAGYPAASLFKLVTMAASVEANGTKSYSSVKFRGGDYTLSRANYNPSTKWDRRVMTVKEAMAKSCNPVFGRLAYSLPRATTTLGLYAKVFGFNMDWDTNFPLTQSRASIPSSDYEISRTGAGFGQVGLSPVHAASIMSGLLERGSFPVPALVEKIISSSGEILYRERGEVKKLSLDPRTASEILWSMRDTTTIGTAKRAFRRLYSSAGVSVDHPIYAKTGTLTGQSPQGLTTWFIANLDSETALAVVSVDARIRSARAPYIGAKIFEQYQAYMNSSAKVDLAYRSRSRE